MENPLRVLIVESEPGLAGLIWIFLQRSGLVGVQDDAEASLARTLASALEKVDALEPDVILLDLSLPDCSGLDGIERLRAVAPNAPILVLTDNDDANFAVRAVAAGAEDYLVKGEFDHRILGRAIRYAMAREAIEARLRLLNSALEVTSNGVVITDAETHIVWANPAFTRLTGYSRGEALGVTPRTLLKSGLNSSELYEKLWQTVLAGETWHGELINRRKDGSLFDEELSITPLRNGRGKTTHYVAIQQDITERKRAARALAESEQRLEMALTGADLGMWDWHIPSGKVIHNRRWSDQIGLHDETNESHVSVWEGMVHPDDLAEVKAALRAHFRGETEFYESEYRSWHQDERWVWILDRGRVVERDANGRAVRALGTHLDISERKQAESALRERETRLATLLASLPDLVLLIDTSGCFTQAHVPGGTWFFEADVPLEGASYSRVAPAPLVQALDEAIAGIIVDGQMRKMEFSTFVGAEERYYQVKVNQLADSGQFPTGFVAVIRDVTERRRAEDKVRNLAYFDTLTNLPNRRLLMDRLQQALAVGERNLRYGALLFVDLDNFKELNDTRGHDVGDLMLVEVAQRLSGCLRAGDTAARLGGDEFVLMLPDLGLDREEALRRARVVCDKVLAVLSQPYILNGYACNSSASLGLTLFKASGQTLAEILRSADQAMYSAKAAGRGVWRMADGMV